MFGLKGPLLGYCVRSIPDYLVLVFAAFLTSTFTATELGEPRLNLALGDTID